MKEKDFMELLENCINELSDEDRKQFDYWTEYWEKVEELCIVINLIKQQKIK